MSEDEKKKFHEMAAEDKKRYQDEKAKMAK